MKLLPMNAGVVVYLAVSVMVNRALFWTFSLLT
jgi:hypothetical protein